MARRHYNILQGFPERLELTIAKRNISCKKLADRVGIRRGTLYGYVHGDFMPNTVIFARLCKELNVSADWLLFGEERE